MNEPLTITAAAPLIRSGELTPSELLEQCLARVDLYEPKVRAWVHLDRERARREAQQLTDEVKAGRSRGPLHGIPIGVKDIIDVFDMPTGCGSKLWANSYARRDATCVERLRQAGALILGKTVTTAYAYLDPPVTRNPWNLDRTPGGSSSGSAAAVACGMCLAALGSQTGGSTIRPASYCGVASLKPTHGRISVDGVLPLAPSLDHIGIMANSAADLRHVWDAYTPVHLRKSGPPQHAVRVNNLADEFVSRIEPEMQAALTQFRLSTTAHGIAWSDLPVPDWFPRIRPNHLVVMSRQAADYHATRLQRLPSDYPPRITELIETGLQHDPKRIDEVMRDLTAARRHFAGLASPLFPDLGHLLAGPATLGPAPEASTTGDPVFQVPWSYLGIPTVSFPISRTRDGMPLAIQLAGPIEADDELLAVGEQLEALVASEHRLPPVT